MGDGYSGIDPARLDEVERQLARAADALGRNEPQIRRLLDRLDLDTSGLAAMRETQGWIAEKRPDLRRRSELIRTEVSEWGPSAAPPSGLSAFDEALYRKTKDPDVYAALVKLGEVSESGEVSPETLEQLDKRAGDANFAAALANALGAVGYRALLARTTQHNGDKDLAQLQATLGKTLGTASPRLTAAWRDELTSDRHLSLPAAKAIAQALTHGKFDRGFLLAVASKLDAWADGPNMLPRVTRDSDVMVPVLQALSRDAKAAQDFFTADPKKLREFVTERRMNDGGVALGKALEAATLTFRDHDGSPQDPSRGYLSAKLASELVHLEAERIEKELAQLVPSASMGRILAGYVSDINHVAETRSEDAYGVRGGNDPRTPGHDVWGARFDATELRAVLKDAFTNPTAFASVLAAQTAFSGRLLDHGAAEVEAGRGDGRLLNSAKQIGMGFGIITDAAGLSKIDEAKELDEAQEKNLKILAAVVNTGLALPQSPGWPVAAAVVSSWTDLIVDEVKDDKESKARAEANSVVAQSRSLVHDLTAQAMLGHGLFGSADPPAKTHPWSSLEGLREGDGPLDNPNNFLKEDGKTLMSRDEMIDEAADNSTDRLRRVDAYNRWLYQGLSGKPWRKVEDRLDIGFERGFAEYGS